MIMEDNKNKYTRAKKRVDELKGFYIHASIYTVINTFILVNIFIRSGYDGEGFWQIEHFFTLFFWGIGLFFHASKVFGLNPFFNKDWEKRQIEKYMEEDREEANKFTKR
ncbi:2TM domain-containing protein [Croceitalea sp. MTPC9]|nr:2TM domain-containing protein [Croceitalea sp. MTPC6]GMN15330.1 2TM domain-containing protein [Croceitalea sp. MTPC9]